MIFWETLENKYSHIIILLGYKLAYLTRIAKPSRQRATNMAGNSLFELVYDGF